VYNFVTKRDLRENAKISWTQKQVPLSLEIPISGFKGDNSTGEFYSIAEQFPAS
jgi:Fe-S cluster assembly scaffold protein SufB